MSARKCGLCGKDPAEGFASINDTFYCHGDNDPTPTCYMRSQSAYVPEREPTDDDIYNGFGVEGGIGYTTEVNW